MEVRQVGNFRPDSGKGIPSLTRTPSIGVRFYHLSEMTILIPTMTILIKNGFAP